MNMNHPMGGYPCGVVRLMGFWVVVVVDSIYYAFPIKLEPNKVSYDHDHDHNHNHNQPTVSNP